MINNDIKKIQKYYDKHDMANYYLWYAPWYRTIAQFIHKDIKGKSLLEIGCRHGFFCEWAISNGAKEVIGIDISKKTVKDGNVKIIQGDIQTVKLNKKFDFIICCEVLEHLENPDKAFKNMASMCNGKLYQDFLNVQEPHNR